MTEKLIEIQPAIPEQHFGEIASLLTTQETEPSTAQSLTEWYTKRLADGIRFSVAITCGKVIGFHGIYRAYTNLERTYAIYLMVNQGYPDCGVGSLLYDHLLGDAQDIGARTLRAWVHDNSERSLRFATKRGYKITKHSIEMIFDLKSWDDAGVEPTLQALRKQGFLFTDMAELGDTPDARRKLYTLNNNASATDPGSDGIPPWASFEEFDRDVCSSSWYHPDAQIVAIDTQNGEWAAMSAITVFESADHAYNLFTGTDVRYRGRKLAQAVKALALRRARKFGVDTVRTSHNSENEAMIAIDQKLGYVRTPGKFIMVKEL
jgi:RimJ/RimL family protein N-acetyltransferase/L-amino acid N-acyltransferase YncA